MITLIKLNLLDCKKHIVYTRTKSNSINLIKDMFSEMNFPVECKHYGCFTDAEVNDIKNTIKESDSIVNDTPNHTPLYVSGSVSSWYYYTGTTSSGGVFTQTATNNGASKWITLPVVNEDEHISFYNLTIYYNKLQDPNQNYYTVSNYSGYGSNLLYEVYVYDDFKKFLNTLNDNENNYYYVNETSFKGEEILDYIENLLGENNE